MSGGAPVVSGKFAALPLPVMQSDGVARAAFMATAVSKHVAMVERAPGIIRCKAGDWTGAGYDDSYRNDEFDWDLSTNTFTLVAAYDAPGLKPPRPDTMGIGWDPRDKRLLLVPGVLTGISAPPFGAWWQNPDKTWTVDKGLTWGTNMMRGGCADWVKRQWFALQDNHATLGTVITTYNVDDFSKSTNTVWKGGDSAFQTYAADSLPCIVGRYAYFVAYTRFADIQKPNEVRFYRWHLDKRGEPELLKPPLVALSTPESTLLLAAGTKVVWPLILGPDGVILELLVFDTVSGIWSEEITRPAVPGNKFLGNGGCGMADGSVIFAGSTFGPTRQTHGFKYTP